jgi:hypothetical protein
VQDESFVSAFVPNFFFGNVAYKCHTKFPTDTVQPRNWEFERKPLRFKSTNEKPFSEHPKVQFKSTANLQWGKKLKLTFRSSSPSRFGRGLNSEAQRLIMSPEYTPWHRLRYYIFSCFFYLHTLLSHLSLFFLFFFFSFFS